MAKRIHDDVYDAALAYFADNGDRMFVCSADPANYTQASATYRLATQNLTVGIGNGDYSKSNGPTDGRMLTLAEQAAIPVLAAGTGLFVAICDSANSKVLGVTPIPSTAMILGNTATIAALTFTVRDAT